MAMKTRADHYHCTTGINTPRLVPTSRLVSSITGVHVQRNKAIVGRNAFAHEAGIHQDGMLKERRTYEIMQPEDVGFQATDLVLGKHSGRAALADRARALGYTLSGEQLHLVFDEFKKLAENDLGEDQSASPAISNGTIYLRTFKHLWAIRQQ